MLGFFLYIIGYLPIIIFVKPHKLEKFMWPAFVGIVGTVFGIMAWAVHENDGSPGSLISPTVKLSASARGFRFVQCISGIAGTYGGSGDRISDVGNDLFSSNCLFTRLLKTCEVDCFFLLLNLFCSGQDFPSTRTLT